MMLSSVDLPQPEGPSRQTNSPRRMSRVMTSSACTRCDASRPGKIIDTCSTAIAAAPAARPDDAAVVIVASPPAVTSELHWNELVIVDRPGLRDRLQDTELDERLADNVDRGRIPGTVGREAF